MPRPFIRMLLLVLALSATFTLYAQEEPTLTRLREIHLDPTQIYSVREISLTRDALSVYLNRGVIAFTEALNGKITGAVFLGSGDILAIPPDVIEKQQLFRFTKSAILNEHFETALFRFTDGTYEEILRQYREHAVEDLDPDAREEVLRWETEIQRRAAFLDDRILTDLLGKADRPFFLAQIEGAHLGWFDAIYDQRRAEEIFLQQNTSATLVPVLWTSFQRRDEVGDREAVAHEDKSLFDVVSISPDGSQLRVRLKVSGERVLELPARMEPIPTVSLQGGPVLPVGSSRSKLSVVLPTPTEAGTELVFQLEYPTPEAGGVLPTSVVPENAIAPASYRDQWIIEALANFAPAMRDQEILSGARMQLLARSPEGGSYDSLGPVWVGFRLGQPGISAEYLSTLRNKSIWIMYMLKHIMDGAGPQVFTSFLDELFVQFHGKSISTFDFWSLAEKHTGRDLDWFFEDWVFGTGIPDYEVTYDLAPSAEGFVISGIITQSQVPDTFEMPVPLYADDVFLGNVPVSSAGGEFHFTTPSRPSQLLIDPLKTVLTQLN